MFVPIAWKSVKNKCLSFWSVNEQMQPLYTIVGYKTAELTVPFSDNTWIYCHDICLVPHINSILFRDRRNVTPLNRKKKYSKGKIWIQACMES